MIRHTPRSAVVDAAALELIASCPVIPREDTAYLEISTRSPISPRLRRRAEQILQDIGGRSAPDEGLYEMPRDARRALVGLLAAGVAAPGVDFCHFESSPDLARRLVRLAEVSPGQRLSVLEPSAGSGAIVRELQIRGAARVDCVEWSPLNRERLLIRTLHASSRLLPQRDFLDVPPRPEYDRVVMAPPFCPAGRGDVAAHVRHACAMLRPRGILVTILPKAVLSEGYRRYDELRDWCRRGRLHEVPAGMLWNAMGEVVQLPAIAVRVEVPA